MKLEELMTSVNKGKRFKLLIFLILSLPAYQSYVQQQNVLMALVSPNYTCTMAVPNVSHYQASPDQCYIHYNNITQKCNEWSFSLDPVGTTMVSDYSLVCDYRNYSDYILTAWYAATIVSLLIGWLSDKVGRKQVVIATVIMETIALVLMSIIPNIFATICFRILLGLSIIDSFLSYTWLQEMADNDFRELSGSFFWFYGCLGYMLFPFIAFYIRNWRIRQIVTTIPNVCYLAILVIPESPRWLMVTGRKKEALESIEKILFINGKKMNKSEINLDDEELEVETSLFDVLSSGIFLQRMMLGSLLFFSMNLFYSGLFVNLKILSNNIFLSIYLNALMEIPGYLISFYSLCYFERKKSLLVLSIIGSISFCITVFLSRIIFWQLVLRVLIGCIAKAVITSVSQSSMVYYLELLPTSHRTFGYSTLPIIIPLTFVSANYINSLEWVLHFVPLIIYCSFASIGLFSMWKWLPETKDLPIPQTVDNIRMLKKGREDLYKEYVNEKSVESDCKSK